MPGSSSTSKSNDIVTEVESAIEGYVLNPKSGLKTSELWLTVLTLGDEFALAKWHTNLHLTDNATWIIGLANGAITVAYTAARTWLKARHVASLPAAPKLS